MKNFFTIALVLFFSSKCISQLTLESGELQTGIDFSLYSLTDVNTDNVIIYGQNVTWDLSGTTATLIGTAQLLDMASTPYALAYPEANFAIKFAIQGFPVTYSLFNHSATELVEVANNVGTPDAVSFINPRQTLVFPFVLNFDHTDIYQKEGQLEKTITNTYDGDGTFISNSSSNTNVIRIFTADDGNTSYNWWTTSPITPLFSGSSNGFILWQSATPLDVMNTGSMDVFEMYPNPAANEIKILNKTLLSHVDILNTNGQLMFSSKQSIIDISILDPGVYFVKAYSAMGTKTEKLVKAN